MMISTYLDGIIELQSNIQSMIILISDFFHIHAANRCQMANVSNVLVSSCSPVVRTYIQSIALQPYRLSATPSTTFFRQPLQPTNILPTSNLYSSQPSHSKMVRLKNRYLLLDILYPDSSTWPSPESVSNGPHAAQLAIHAPTSDALTPGLLAKMIREEVGEMYGDWGVGKLGGASATGVQGRLLALPYFPPSIRLSLD